MIAQAIPAFLRLQLSTVEAAVAALIYIGLFAALFCRRITKADL